MAAKVVAAPSRLARLVRWLLEACVGFIKLLLLAWCCLRAYRIRLYAVNTFGYIIHEFDPWFNYRATQYLAKNGWYSFFHWYDYMSWYPLGRPIGTTIYPGMQITAVAIWKFLKLVPKAKWSIPKEVLGALPKSWTSKAMLRMLPGHGTLTFGPMTLNQVCCMTPAWYGALATFLMFLLTWEVSGSSGAGLAAAFVMAIIPAHMMRSAAGEFDNECVAVAAFCLVFWLWCRALRTPQSWPFAILGGIAYSYAVATWGGYIFVINLIGMHAALLVAVGKWNWGVYRTYTLFYVIGTAGATLVPVVGWTPLRSIEQIAPLAVFLGYQLLQFCEVARRRKNHSAWRFFVLRVCVFAVAGASVAAVGYILMQQNFFGPLSSRIRGLFIKHEKTGNPLVDSVAEHKAANSAAYDQYLHNARYVAFAGLFLCWHQRSPAKFFPVLYAAVAYHFSLKMSRLMIICGPIVSILAGYPVGILGDWSIEQAIGLICGASPLEEVAVPPERSGGMGSILRTSWSWLGGVFYPAEVRDMLAWKDSFRVRFPWLDRPLRAAIGAGAVYMVYQTGREPLSEFVAHCDRLAVQMSSAKIVFENRDRQTGESTIVWDYYEGYKWLGKNTPEDARVMAWWDYGYQITGVANRTTIADGNTWNHEHIATLGRTLTNPERKAHNIMRHLADYVLVWAGGRSDDMAKSPHLARIANSIFPDVCGVEDPTCTKFGMDYNGNPTPMMAKSFLYRAVNHNVKNGVVLDKSLFEEVHHSKHGLLRIFKVLNVSQESKDWLADPSNRVCDAPGSWYCVGKYPPALKKLISKRKNFAQLEDFNKKGMEKSAYTKLVEKSQKEGKGGEL